MNRTVRTLAQATTCMALSAAFIGGCFYAATPTAEPARSQTLGSAPGSTFRALTTEQIDVLAEGDEPDRRWETCLMNTDYAISCPDGTWHEYPVPNPDGGVIAPRSHADMLDLVVCAGEDVEPTLPCRVAMDETYVVGGNGTVHDGCTVVLRTREDSDMVCTDDTVWAS